MGDQAVEQVVLRLLEVGQLGDDGRAMARHRVGVLLRLSVLVLGEGRLGHQGTKSGIIRGLGQCRKLLVGDAELVAEGAEALRDLRQLPLEHRPGHREKRSGEHPARRRLWPAVLADSHFLMRRLVLLAFIWGWSFLFIKVAVEGMTPTTVAAARIALGAIALHAVLIVRKVTLPTNRTFWHRAAVTAIFANILPFTLLAWGEERITSALTAVLNASTPLFTALAAAVMLRTKLGARAGIGLIVGIGGVAVAAGVGGADLAHSSITGSLAAVGAGACYGFGFTYAAKHQLHESALVAATGQLTAGAVLLTPVAIATSISEGVDLEPHRIVAVVLLGAVGTGIAYILYYQLVAALGPTTTSLVTYLVPVTAVAVGIAFLDENFHVRVLLGGAMIVLGIALVQRRLQLPGRRSSVPASTGG